MYHYVVYLATVSRASYIQLSTCSRRC